MNASCFFSCASACVALIASAAVNARPMIFFINSSLGVRQLVVLSGTAVSAALQSVSF